MQQLIKGFVIEAEKGGYYYHRTRGWIQYDSPTRAFVWSKEDAEQILESSKKNAKKWKLLPGKLHPATYFVPVKGYTTIDHPAIAASEFGSSSIFTGQVLTADSNELFNVSSGFVTVDVHL